jgi:hypothetical protein
VLTGGLGLGLSLENRQGMSLKVEHAVLNAMPGFCTPCRYLRLHLGFTDGLTVPFKQSVNNSVLEWSKNEQSTILAAALV